MWSPIVEVASQHDVRESAATTNSAAWRSQSTPSSHAQRETVDAEGSRMFSILKIERVNRRDSGIDSTGTLSSKFLYTHNLTLLSIVLVFLFTGSSSSLSLSLSKSLICLFKLEMSFFNFLHSETFLHSSFDTKASFLFVVVSCFLKLSRHVF